jgi:hypothetical protein
VRKQNEYQLLTVISGGRCGGKPEMAGTSAFFGSVKPKAFCQKRLKLSFPAPFFFGSFLFGRTKRNEHLKTEVALYRQPA